MARYSFDFALPSESAQSLETLKKGNERFVANLSSAREVSARERLAELARRGQSPKVTIVSCSDSRVPPEIVFDQGIGDLFVVRSAGHVLSFPAIASIEFSVAVLGVKLIVVKGHSQCGAVKAAIEAVNATETSLAPSAPSANSAPSESLQLLIERLAPAVRSAEIERRSKDTSPQDTSLKDTLNDEEFLREAIRKNVELHASYIVEMSAIVRDKLQSDQLGLVGAYSDMASGRVEFIDLSSLMEKSFGDLRNLQRA